MTRSQRPSDDSKPAAARLRQTMHQAAIAGDVGMLAALVAVHGAAAARCDSDPEEVTTLHVAALAGSVDAVEYLLSPRVGAEPCAAHGNAFTPLHSAAMRGHAEVCKMLLDVGADVNAQTDPQKYTPLHSAAFAGHEAAIRVLVTHGADRNLLNYRGERPADTARRTGQLSAVSMLKPIDA